MTKAPSAKGGPVAALLRITQPLRLIHYLMLIAFETTLISLIGNLIGNIFKPMTLNWPAMFVVVAIAAFAGARFDSLHKGWRSLEARAALLAAATIIWGTKAQVDGASLLSGWGMFGHFLTPSNGGFLTAYVALLTILWAWIAGSQITELGHRDIVEHLQRGLLGIGALLILQALFGLDVVGQDPGIAGMHISGEIVLLLSCGLLSLSSARFIAIEGTTPTRLQWLHSGIVSSAAVLVVGVSILALFTASAGTILRSVMLWAFYILTLLLAPILWLLSAIAHWLLPTPGSLPLPPVQLQNPAPTATALPEGALTHGQFDGVGLLFTIIMGLVVLIPVAVLVLLILYRRRRAHTNERPGDEERTSLFTWGALGNDLAAWMRNLRPRPSDDTSLRGILRQLQGDDPTLRIRRRYIQLLMRGEEADRHRAASQTPHEFEPDLAIDTTDRPAVATLTDAYQQARYAPMITDTAVADKADRAWETLERE